MSKSAPYLTELGFSGLLLYKYEYMTTFSYRVLWTGTFFTFFTFLVEWFLWNEFHKSINSYLDYTICRFLNYDFMLASFFLNLDIENEVFRVFYIVNAPILSTKLGYWNCWSDSSINDIRSFLHAFNYLLWSQSQIFCFYFFLFWYLIVYNC